MIGEIANMNEILVAIEITPETASKIRLMADAGIFDMVTGNATLSFLDGNLKTVKTERFTYAQPVHLTSLTKTS